MSNRRRDARMRIEAELAATKAELERANRALALNALAGAAAHELSQPITALALNAMAVLRQLEDGGEARPAIRDCIERIAADADRARAIIANFRASAAGLAPRQETFDVGIVVGEALALLDGELRGAAVLVDTRLGAGLPPVTGDRLRLRQLFLNLIANAVQALSGVFDRPRRLTIDGEWQADRLVIAVRDNGAGLDPAIARRIFEAGISARPGGLGLGLFLCRAIVQDHGGTIGVAAQPRETSFHVAFPVPASGA